MDLVALSRWQFALTAVYHFFFVPLTLGLGWLVAILETLYVRSGNENYKRLTKFWGKLFLINYAMGVVTGIVMEFQFGMNWSGYSRFVGDVFGSLLAIEGLLAFFLESTFIGAWLFGWERMSKKLHCVLIWLVAIGGNLSAFWILAANGFMQHPVGYALNQGRAEMVNFWQLVFNLRGVYLFLHAAVSGLVTGSFFMLGISIYLILRKKDEDAFKLSFRLAAVTALISSVLVGVVGDMQGRYLRTVQPMAAAASEAHFETADPAPFSVVALFDSTGKKVVWDLQIPGVLSFLYFYRFSGEVEGINQLQQQYVELYGPGDYVPLVALTYWTFRVMVGVGLLMIALSGLAILYWLMGFPEKWKRYLRWGWLILFLPYVANTTGWILTEAGRQPWIVHGLMLTEQAVSKLAPGAVLFSLVGFIVVYSILIAVDAFLLVKFARAGLPVEESQPTAY